MHYNFDGTLGVWHEPGSPGLVWVLDCPRGIDSVNIVLGNRLLLREGDLLTIWNERDREIFHGTVRPDFLMDWTPFTKQDTRLTQWMADHWERYSLSQREAIRFFLGGMPRVNGIWIVWTQRGVETCQWLNYFMPRADQPALRARVMRPKDPKKMIIHSKQRSLTGGNIIRP